MAVTPEEIALLRQKIREKNRPTDESRRRRLKELLRGKSLQEALSTTPAGIDEIARNQQIFKLAKKTGLDSELANEAEALQSNNIPLDLTQDDIEFGTGDLLMRDRTLASSKLKEIESNPLKVIDFLDPTVSRNQEMSDIIQQELDVPAKKNQKQPKSSDAGLDTPADPTFQALDDFFAATMRKDLSADALSADITAGIGEQFMGRQPSMSLTKSGKFSGNSPVVAAAMIKDTRERERMRSNERINKIKLKLANRKINMDMKKLDESVLSDKARNEIRKANNKVKAVNKQLQLNWRKTMANRKLDQVTGKVNLAAILDPEVELSLIEEQEALVKLLEDVVGLNAEVEGMAQDEEE